MGKKIRIGCWETNSSSSHSISLGRDESKPFILNIGSLMPDDNGIISINAAHTFGQEQFKYNDTLVKAIYAIGQVGKDEVIEVIEEVTKGTVKFEESANYWNNMGVDIDHDSIGILEIEDIKEFIFNRNSWLHGDWYSGSYDEYKSVPVYLNETDEGSREYKYSVEFPSHPQLNYKTRKFINKQEVLNYLNQSMWALNVKDSTIDNIDKWDIDEYVMLDSFSEYRNATNLMVVEDNSIALFLNFRQKVYGKLLESGFDFQGKGLSLTREQHITKEMFRNIVIWNTKPDCVITYKITEIHEISKWEHADKIQFGRFADSDI